MAFCRLLFSSVLASSFVSSCSNNTVGGLKRIRFLILCKKDEKTAYIFMVANVSVKMNIRLKLGRNIMDVTCLKPELLTLVIARCVAKQKAKTDMFNGVVAYCISITCYLLNLMTSFISSFYQAAVSFCETSLVNMYAPRIIRSVTNAIPSSKCTR